MTQQPVERHVGSGPAATRNAIRAAATRLFAARGYAATSVRAVAMESGADPALVIRYFGSKEQLFLVSIPAMGALEQIAAGPLDGLGHRLVASLVDPLHAPQLRAYRAMMWASDSRLVRARLVEAREQLLVEPLAARLEGPSAALRSRLIAAHVAGLLDGLAILQDDHVTCADRAALVSLYGYAIQSLVEGAARPARVTP